MDSIETLGFYLIFQRCPRQDKLNNFKKNFLLTTRFLLILLFNPFFKNRRRKNSSKQIKATVTLTLKAEQNKK